MRKITVTSKPIGIKMCNMPEDSFGVLLGGSQEGCVVYKGDDMDPIVILNGSEDEQTPDAFHPHCERMVRLCEPGEIITIEVN